MVKHCKNCLRTDQLTIVYETGLCEYCDSQLRAEVACAFREIDYAVASLKALDSKWEIDLAMTGIRNDMVRLQRWTSRGVAVFGVNIEALLEVLEIEHSQALSRAFDHEVRERLSDFELTGRRQHDVGKLKVIRHVARLYVRTTGAERIREEVEKVIYQIDQEITRLGAQAPNRPKKLKKE